MPGVIFIVSHQNATSSVTAVSRALTFYWTPGKFHVRVASSARIGYLLTVPGSAFRLALVAFFTRRWISRTDLVIRSGPV
jgi:hypothetical protein